MQPLRIFLSVPASNFRRLSLACALIVVVLLAAPSGAQAKPPIVATAAPGTYPRVLADVNGDGIPDIVGFTSTGVLVALGLKGGGFGPATYWSTSYGQNNGWTDNNTYPRMMADVNGDGKADIVGFGNNGVYVSLSTGSSFAAPVLWSTGYGHNGGWTDNNAYPRILADVNGDGKADIVGFGYSGVYVSLSTGSGFTAPAVWYTGFTYKDTWTDNNTAPRMMADVNGDGKADIVGFGYDGVYVSLSTGSGFGPASIWITGYGHNYGWTDNNTTPRMMADVNGDGKADIVGFGGNGVYVSLSTGSGFPTAPLWITGYGQNYGWTNNNNYPRTLADVNGDGKADIVGFGYNGVYVSPSTGSGFPTAPVWTSGFSYADTWTDNINYPRIVADVNGDGKADIVGFGASEVYVSLSSGTGFNSATVGSYAFTGGANWGCARLAANSWLTPGQSIMSCNGLYTLLFQLDGNVVLKQGSTALWATGTNGKGSAKLVMQTDGNLVLYSTTNAVLWASSQHGGTLGSPGYLTLLDDANMTITSATTGAYLWISGTVVRTPATLPDSAVATDWLAKDICADAANRPVPADPYYVCPTGTSLRKIQPGDPLPYYNFDQPSIQQSDTFPLLDAYGNALYMHTFDYPPYNQFNLYSGSDGYDYYLVDSTWVSSPGTRDGGGYGTEFFGPNCALGDAWVYFPSSSFLNYTGGASAVTPISGNIYWEQNLLSYPGNCVSNYDYPTTFWQTKATSFGGLDGNPVKTMDAMVAFHNYHPTAQYNLEVYWFTQQYGLTMWQSWAPASAINPDTGLPYTKTTNCIVPNTVSFGGFTYVVNDCHDWSNVKLATTAVIPQWPLPPANLLQHSHFDDGGGFLTSNDGSFYNWHRGGNSAEGNIINWGTYNSTVKRDTKYGTGVRYLAINCDGTCTGAGVQEIYQEVPIGAIASGGTYLYGIDARSESSTGTLQVTLQELDGSNNVLWQDYIQGNVALDNGDGRDNEYASFYLSSAFIHKTAVIPVISGATRLRFYITPLTPQTFDILDTWLNRFPAVNGALGVTPP